MYLFFCKFFAQLGCHEYWAHLIFCRKILKVLHFPEGTICSRLCTRDFLVPVLSHPSDHLIHIYPLSTCTRHYTKCQGFQYEWDTVPIMRETDAWKFNKCSDEMRWGHREWALIQPGPAPLQLDFHPLQEAFWLCQAGWAPFSVPLPSLLCPYHTLTTLYGQWLHGCPLQGIVKAEDSLAHHWPST